jgi:outer membrane protein assembly factor BamA
MCRFYALFIFLMFFESESKASLYSESSVGKIQHLTYKTDSIPDHTVKVKEIITSGNTKTKENAILRELDFVLGDNLSISNIANTFQDNEKRLLSTLLFTDAQFNIKEWNTDEQEVVISLDLKENWYIYPFPILELADRNFNVWWKDENFSLSRVNYGIRLDHFNLTGMRDRLKIKWHTGFTRKLELDYDYPYVWNAWGLAGNILYSDAKEVHSFTLGNRQNFVRAPDERILLTKYRGDIALNRRKNAYRYEKLGLNIIQTDIDAYITENINQNFFNEGSLSQRIVELYYQYRYDKRRFPIYPEGSYLLEFEARKQGLFGLTDLDNLFILVKAEYNKTIIKNLFSTISITGKTNLAGGPIPFYNNQAIGYGDNQIKGYELYVVDGTDYLISRANIRYQVLDKNFKLPGPVPFAQLKTMPLKLYLRFSADMAYINEAQFALGNPLSNTLLTGYGFGLDILTYYTFLSSIEYNFNQLGEHGLVLNFAIVL